MNEGVPVQTIAIMVVATVVAAAIVGLILIYLGAPPGYVYHAASEARAPIVAAVNQIISTAAVAG